MPLSRDVGSRNRYNGIIRLEETARTILESKYFDSLKYGGLRRSP